MLSPINLWALGSSLEADMEGRESSETLYDDANGNLEYSYASYVVTKPTVLGTFVLGG